MSFRPGRKKTCVVPSHGMSVRPIRRLILFVPFCRQNKDGNTVLETFHYRSSVQRGQKVIDVMHRALRLIKFTNENSSKRRMSVHSTIEIECEMIRVM